MGAEFRAVRPMSGKEIEEVAMAVRDVFQIGPTKGVQMINLVERFLPEALPGYQFGVLPDDHMPGMAGLTPLGEYTILLSESTYTALYANDPEARYVAAHELGHLILHSQQQPSYAHRTFTDDRVDPEWQADRFAEAWLMPRAGVEKCRSANHVAAKFGVPDEVAQRRFEEVKMPPIQGELF